MKAPKENRRNGKQLTGRVAHVLMNLAVILPGRSKFITRTLPPFDFNHKS